MEKALYLLIALSLTLVVLGTPKTTSAAVMYQQCPLEYDGGGTGPICNCVIHCGNNYYWSGTVPSSACSDAYQLCCGGWGQATCN